MKGFRPSFYSENPNLQSIEILAWAVKQPCFTLSDVKAAFAKQLEEYVDSTHEMSERLRKLAKSGMIVVADEGLLVTQEKILEANEAAKRSQYRKPVKQEEPKEDLVGTITPERLSIIRQVLMEMKNQKRGKGRPPRLYFTTQAASKYVESRAADLLEIAKRKSAENK